MRGAFERESVRAFCSRASERGIIRPGEISRAVNYGLIKIINDHRGSSLDNRTRSAREAAGIDIVMSVYASVS